VQHTLWQKRPDWVGVVGVPRLYNRSELRMSYVTWQEGVNPFVIVELLSPETENEDLRANTDEERRQTAVETASTQTKSTSVD
jgi:Uma2 family endonuclease